MRYYKIIDGETVFFKGNVLYTENETIINPSQEQMLANGWLEYVEPEPTEEELVERAKRRKIRDIERYDETMEVFLINGQDMWLGHELRQQIRTSADAYSAMGYETMTKVFEGAEFTFPIPVWVQMLNVLEVYAAEVLNATERNKAAVNLLNSVDDIEAYDIEQGYPEIIEFTPERLRAMSGL